MAGPSVSYSNLTDRQTLSVTGGFTHFYINIKAQDSNPTFLLLHGFPISVYDWRKQITSLSAAGYGIPAPDLLGYGETDHPDDVEEYTQSKMAVHVAEILEKEGLSQVIGAGHDWGSGLLSRLWINHPQYISSLVFMAAPYQTPAPMDLDAINDQTLQSFVYPVFGYWYFFNETSAADVIAQKPDSFASICYSSNPDLWKSDFCPVGKLQDGLQGGKSAPLPSWITREELDEHRSILSKGGYTGPLNWYRATICGIDAENDAKIPQEALVIPKPVLFVVGELDAIGRPELAFQSAEQGREAGLLPDVEVKVVPGSAHWIGLEKPKETFDILDQFAKKVCT